MPHLESRWMPTSRTLDSRRHCHPRCASEAGSRSPAGEASPSEIAERVEQPLNAVAYHVRRLHDLECLELVRTESPHGGRLHVYRPLIPVSIRDDAWARLPV